jgi:acetolactate synthase-1/2/3 large subunit
VSATPAIAPIRGERVTPPSARASATSGAAHVVRALVAEGVDLLFGYPGGAILPLYDALYDAPIRHVLTRHEQAAIFAAEAYARVSGKVGVVLATSGPGATNLVSGLADAFLDSVPLVAITGQVPTSLMGTDAFQEVDLLGITMPIVKHSFLVRDAADLPRVLHRAFDIARSGRPGPVLVDIPKDVLLADAAVASSGPISPVPPPPCDLPSLERARHLLSQARRPLAYGGGGIFLGGATDAFRAFVETTGMPSVLTLKGLGALPSEHPQNLGMLGMHGGKAANLAVQECDLLVAVGARFDDRVTGKLAEFAPFAKVIHLDVDPAEMGKRKGPDAPVVGELKASLAGLTKPLDIAEWRDRCADLVADEPIADRRYEGVFAPRFLRELSRAALASGKDAYVAADVGQHQMWVAQHWRLDRPEQHLSSGGLGAMGFGFPAAIGAQLAKPDALVINVSGDGGFQMNLQELATIGRYRLPVKIVVVDNQRLGMVRQWQELFMDERYSETDLSDNPDFVRIAQAYDVPAVRLDRADDEAAIIRQIVETDGPLLVHVVIDPQENVWPFVPPGGSNAEMLEEP